MAWNLGLLGAAGAPAGAFELIQTQTLSSNTASVTFSSIPQTYKHLQLRVSAKDSWATSGVSFLWMRFNGVATGLTYSHHYIYSWIDNLSARGISSPGNNQIEIHGAAATSTATDSFSASVIDILDYANTSKNTTIRALSGADRGDSGGTGLVALHGGFWNNTAAVNSIFLSSAIGGASLLTGSRFSLYGIKG